ncbi:putative membrane protein YcfT [Mycetocola sp. BIGb0189]|uniref:CapA family protein n=1 Tax=Mycetocola sp. BIGb0189 TaxID=2940604 RepID=UPI002169B893|nr:CapA family protein [Mycetocola sp. BIGb0189]MCS4275165.1 putative membrane protein YcfT [Mycetocola sp. BIGb0189]
MSTPRLLWPDVAKGLLIILVVFWHTVVKTYLQVDWRLPVPIPGAWGMIADITYPVRMPLFFLISGCFAASALARPWGAVLRNRVVRFLYLYLLWTLIHTAAMWAFPDFPTLVPRSVAAFIEAITISPTNTWYLYALALYFVVAKGLRGVPRWIPLGLAAGLSIAVGAGVIDIVSNRGSLIANLLFFLIGAYASRHMLKFAARPRPILAGALALLYLGAFALVRATAAEHVPGVLPVLALIGVGMGLAIAPLLARIPKLGTGLAAVGARTLPIYMIHIPVLVLIDALLVGPLSDAGGAVQLAAAITLPAIVIAVVIAASLWIARLIARDGLRWLLDLPSARHTRRTLPWRIPLAVLSLVAIGIAASAATALPVTNVSRSPLAGTPGVNDPHRPAHRTGEVSIGAVGDILLYDASRGIPADQAAGYFDHVRPWFTEDIVTGNLEQALTSDNGTNKCARLNDCFAFRSDPAAASSLRGFTDLNLANNHSRDFGQGGYDATRAALEGAGIRPVGDRDEISCTRVGELTVAMIGFAPYSTFNRVTDLRHVRKIVRTAAERADIVIVQAHMGAEGAGADAVRPGTETMFGENRGDPIAFAHAAIDAGADLVLGHGPHILRGMEWYRGKLIAYSLGNFGGGGVFGKDPATRFGAYLSVTLSADGTVSAARVRSIRLTQADGIPLPDPTHRAAHLMNQRGVRDLRESAAIISPDGTVAPARVEP